ncbi:MAG: DNA replication and repair protein RecF, partial [Pseudorhodobacter sp.]
VQDPHWYRALEARMVEAATLIDRNRLETLGRLKAAQTGADTAFPRADLTITNPEPVADLATTLAEGRRRDMAAGRSLAGPHRADLSGVYADKAVPADQCSTGEQKALLISLILANARALAAEIGAAPILLLDEVAAHLDAQRRAALYDEICALGAQAIMTGTENMLFDSLAGRAQGFALSETQNQSHIEGITL